MAGHGIHDMWDTEAQQNINGVSKYAWVETLGKYLDLPVVNCAIPGSSNKEIAYQIHNFDFHPKDLVIVNWTFMERSSIISLKDEHGSNYKLSIHNTDQINKNWINDHAYPENLYFESVSSITSAKWFLDHEQVANKHLFLKQFYWRPQPNYIDKLKDDIIDIQFDFRAGDRGYDNSHPNLQSYNEYALTIYEWMKRNEDFNKWQ